jgi:hypothetical protein
VGPRAGLEDLEKRKFFTLPGLELRSLGRPARSQSLYRLHYPGSRYSANSLKKLPSLISDFFWNVILSKMYLYGENILATSFLSWVCHW